MKIKLFDIFIWSAIRVRSVYNKDFKCKVREEKYRIIHPLILLLFPFMVIYYLYNWGIKSIIEEIRYYICIY